ncbi:MAG: hypothetical protein MRY59_02385 [Aquisalinus sp.]|nr:hypothetical protein [Aquisalinus sp.]
MSLKPVSFKAGSRKREPDGAFAQLKTDLSGFSGPATKALSCEMGPYEQTTDQLTPKLKPPQKPKKPDGPLMKVWKAFERFCRTVIASFYTTLVILLVSTIGVVIAMFLTGEDMRQVFTALPGIVLRAGLIVFYLLLLFSVTGLTRKLRNLILGDPAKAKQAEAFAPAVNQLHFGQLEVMYTFNNEVDCLHILNERSFVLSRIDFSFIKAVDVLDSPPLRKAAEPGKYWYGYFDTPPLRITLKDPHSTFLLIAGSQFERLRKDGQDKPPATNSDMRKESRDRAYQFAEKLAARCGLSVGYL